MIVIGRNAETLRLARQPRNGRVQVVESDPADETQVAALFDSVAAAAAFLASTNASFVTGAELVVDGALVEV